MDRNNALPRSIFPVHSLPSLAAPTTGQPGGVPTSTSLPENLAALGIATADAMQAPVHAAPTANVSGPVPEMPELREPDGMRIARSQTADMRRGMLWRQMLTHPYPTRVREWLTRENPSELATNIKHGLDIFSVYRCTTRAAEARSDHATAKHDGDRADRELMRLQSAAALITSSFWPVARKLEALMQIHDGLAKEGVLLGAFQIFGDTFLHLAMRSPASGHELARLVEFFLAAGADPNKPCADGRPPAHFLKDKADCVPALCALLQRGAKPQARDSFDHTLPHVLVTHPQSVAALHACEIAGADLYAVTERGETLLHMLLAKRDDHATTQYLLQRDVDVDARTWVDLTAADLQALRHAEEAKEARELALELAVAFHP